MRILGIALFLSAACCGAAAGGAAGAGDEPVPPAARAVDNPNVCVANAGSRGWCGDGGLAGQARLAGPRDVAPLADGGFLVADTLNHVVRRVDAQGIITTVAGIAAIGSSGDGGPAVQARLDSPTGIAVLGDGFVVADPAAHVVRRVDADGTIQPLAGTGRAGTSGDGGGAVRATLRAPRAVAALDDGGVLIADADAHRVRRVAPDGTISTFAGTGVAGTAGDGGPATAASLQEPTYVALEPGGGVLIADRGAARIRRVAADGTISTVAGGEVAGTAATALRLQLPSSVTSTRDGGFLVAEAALIRQVHPDGTTRVAAGTGALGFNDPFNRNEPANALATQLMFPTAVAWLGDAGALVADASNDRIRRLNLSGGIRTIAGFDRPDQVLGAPPPPGTGAPAVRAAAGRASCSERSAPGRYNVLRFVPTDPEPGRRGRRVKMYVNSSAVARVTLTVRPPKGRAPKPVPLAVTPRADTAVPLRPRHRGAYRIKIVGTTKAKPRGSRCAERVLRVR